MRDPTPDEAPMAARGRSRRSVLRWLAACIALGAVPVRPGIAWQRALDAAAAADALLPPPGSASIGRLFLRERPEEADPRRLRRLLDLPDDVHAALSAPELAALYGRLQELHREDFRAGRVYELDGWVLSLTELRLAALVALHTDDGPERRDDP